MILNFGNSDNTLNMIIKKLNWLCHEMTEGRVNNNKLLFEKETSNMKTPLSIAFVKMVEKGEIDEVTARENAEMFLNWYENTNFNVGDFRTFSTEEKGLRLYKCLQAHTSQAGWTPDISPALWKECGVADNGILEWSQPISSADAYMKGDECMYKGVHKRSTIDNNVWSPEEYPEGWEDVIEEENTELPSGDEVTE